MRPEIVPALWVLLKLLLDEAVLAGPVKSMAEIVGTAVVPPALPPVEPGKAEPLPNPLGAAQVVQVSV